MSAFLPQLKQKGHLEQLHMTVCSVGSRKLEPQDDYASKGWDIFAPDLTIYGFDADSDACDVANADLEKRQVNWTEKHIPLAIGKTSGQATLYMTQHPVCSSLYPPNERFFSRFTNMSEFMNLDSTIEIATTTLDEFCQQENIAAVDFLQVDVQGADLDVLYGATQLVQQSISAIQIEVEPSPLYLNQPLFADVDQHLRTQGYTLFDLKFGRRFRQRSPIASPDHPGQILWGDAFYFYDLLRDDIALSRPKTPDRLFKLACVADVMDFPDYALELLEYLTLNYGSDPAYNFADSIVATLAESPELVEHGLALLPIVHSIWDYISQDTFLTFLSD